MAQLKAVMSGAVMVTPDNLSVQGSVASTSFAVAGTNAAPRQHTGSANYQVESPGSFEALAWPANLRARLFHLRVKSGGPLSIRVTHATAGVVTHPGCYQLVIEVGEAEQLSAAAVQGEAEIEWIAFGATATS